MAMSSSEWPCRCNCSISSPTTRASSSRIPHARDGRLFARLAVGEQGLSEAVAVLGDEMRSGGENMGGRAIIALQPDHFGAGEILLETQDIVDVRAAPAIDRLVVVADAADVLPRVGAAALGEQAQPEILHGIGVLVLVHQDIFEALLVFAQHIRDFRAAGAGIPAEGRRNRRR